MKPLEQKAFSLFQKIGLARYPFCERPSCSSPAQSVHHVFRRSNSGTAFEPSNGMSLCSHCHDGWARSNPGEVHIILKRKIGAKEYERLFQLATNVVKIKDWELANIVSELESQLKQIKGAQT